jgi:hypothetical protein
MICWSFIQPPQARDEGRAIRNPSYRLPPRQPSFAVRHSSFFLLLFLSVFGLQVSLSATTLPPTHSVYIWQRSWADPVRNAVQEHGTNFSGLVALNAEVSWKAKQPNVAHVALDHAALAGTKRPIGLALRIGPFSGPFQPDDQAARCLAALAQSLVSEARSHQLKPSELQLDFDCAESRLDGYRVWVNAIRKKIAPVPLTITVLPSWLKQPAFKGLIAATDGYVLQVHSLERPQELNAPFTLCDTTAALKTVKQAGEFPVPFRIALPTYGYLIAFDESGRFLGLSAEGASKSWPAGTKVREVRANPLEIVRLVQAVSKNCPSSLCGFIWYRFPISGDTLNWRWPTLCAMISARFPRESLRAESRRVEPGLIEVSLVNDGELDISSRLAIEVRWSRDGGSRLVAADGLRGFEQVDGGPSTVQFKNPSQSYRLPAGESQVIGWLRFSEDREVQVECKKF